MGYWYEIIEGFGLTNEDFAGESKVTLYDGVGGYIEGHKGLFSYTAEEVVVRLKRGNLVLSGEKLRIVRINDSEIFVTGKIAAVTRTRL